MGYENLKKFVRATAGHPKAKGIILLGPAGTGKSHFCKALAAEIGIPMVTIEMAEWFGSFVGETEGKVRVHPLYPRYPCSILLRVLRGETSFSDCDWR